MALNLLADISPWRPSHSPGLHIRSELFAALIGAILVIPQGITFAYLAGLPPEYGIYTAIFVTLFASLFGTSSMLGGPNTAVAILIGIAVAPFAGRGSPLYIEYVLLLSFMVGLIQLTIWLLRGGRFFMYLSPAAITGITTGVGFILILSSLDGIFGLSSSDTHFFYHKLYFLFDDAENLVNPFSFTVGAITVVAGMIARHYIARYAILIAITVGYLCGLLLMSFHSQVEMELELLGHLPINPLPVSHPPMGTDYLITGLAMLPDALIIALIGLAQSMVIVKQLRNDTDQPIQPDKEVFAQGIANLMAPFFSSFAGSGSFNRTQVNQSMHAETPLTGIVSAGIVLVLILLLGPVLTYLPMPAISGTLMLVGIGMIKTDEIKRLFNWRGELAVFTTTLFCIVFLGLQTGLVVALILSVLLFVISASSLELIVEREAVSVKIRVEGHLFYASIDQLSQILKKHRRENVILDLSVVTYLDLSATEAIAKELAKRNNESTFFAVKLSSERLQNQFETRMTGQPVQFIQYNHTY
ncbi:MAG: SulP family inorganic anion transporter [Candidatus Thiodiazotropha taylori]|nr:SulP family inorganic anion transporter [Candidatus Thiodiazotropha taylori]